MSWLWTNLILWCSLIWLPWLMCHLLGNEARPKKNIIVGVTLPYEAQADPAVEELLASYQKQLRQAAWLLTVPALPCLFLRSAGLSMTLWFIWIIAACVVPTVPYVRCNRALARLKEERGWKRQSGEPAVIDLKAAAEKTRWLSPLWFLPPFLVSLVPLLFQRALWWLWLLNAGITALFYVCYRFLYRDRSEVVDANTARTAALTRIRRYNWGKAWLICAWATGAFSLGLWLTLDHVWLCMAVILLYSLVLCLAVLSIEMQVRRLQEKLTAGSGRDFFVDEDEHWIWGMLYFNPNDSHLLVNARVGMNATFNFARRSAQVIAALVLALLLACPLIGVWLMGMEKAPVELSVTDTAIVGSHFGSRYTVPLSEIESAELLEELPPMSRVAGTALSGAKTGTWTSDGWGRFTCCIDPGSGPWLLLRTGDGQVFLFGGGDLAAVNEAAAALGLP